MEGVTPGCVVLVTHVDEAGAGAGGGAEGSDEKTPKKCKKDTKDKETSGAGSGAGAGAWAGEAGPGDLAVACWFGKGGKGKSLSVLASKAEGSHLLYQLRESMVK